MNNTIRQLKNKDFEVIIRDKDSMTDKAVVTVADRIRAKAIEKYKQNLVVWLENLEQDIFSSDDLLREAKSEVLHKVLQRVKEHKNV